MAPDSYTITAEAVLLTDEDLTNNLKTRSIVLNVPLGAIVGTVTDALTGDPIQGATINANGYSASTDADGHYNITDIPVGTYTITASKTGYENASQHNILVVAGANTTVNFTLLVLKKPASSVPLYIYVTAAGVAAIIVAAVAFYFLRVKKTKPT